jgi:DNA repair photolyase
MPEEKQSIGHGRGSNLRPPNRFQQIYVEPDFEHADKENLPDELTRRQTQFFVDASQSIVSENDSPDVPFRYSVNPYRGCEHGCAYCYARPSHEYLGFNAGIDFESRIMVKLRAAELLRDWLSRECWEPETIVFSGVTDCYQPAERKFQLTRGCLQVALEAKQPVGIITKNALVTRDLDLLREMSHCNVVDVSISVTSLDSALARMLEPRTSSPEARLRAIRELSETGIPVRVMVAPIIPGLNDSEIPQILEAAAEAGARSAGTVLLRLPHAVRPIFLDWLQQHAPLKAARVESLIRATRSGKLNDPNFGSRMRGSGPLAEQIKQTFKVFAKRAGLDLPLPPLDASHFRAPTTSNGQLRLF